MNALRRLIAPVFALGVVVVAACGGAVQGSGSQDAGACADTRGACSPGQRCTTTYPNCPGDPPGITTCDCVEGRFSCPLPGAPRCPDVPVEPCGFAGQVSDGESCVGVRKGETCDAYACPYQGVRCTCNGARFECGACPAEAGADASPVDAGGPG